MKTTLRTVVVSVLCATSFGAERQDYVLDEVLLRARDYVAGYEDELGNMVGEEEYSQRAVWRSRSERARGGPVWQEAVQERLLSSDFLLVRVGDTWRGVRDVREVDGVGVEVMEDFAAAVVDSLSTLISAWPDNVRYNIGNFERTFNIPTFALSVLRPSNFSRFFFEGRPGEFGGGQPVWEVRFREIVSPTLVQGFGGNDRFASGAFWVSPDTGEILKTEITFEMDGDGQRYSATMTVSYASNSELGMLVPVTMEEHYDSEFHSIDARATYHGFKRFETEVKVDLGTVDQ